MRLNYSITEEIYAEVIEYQMKLHNGQKSRVIKYWVSNLIFLGLAAYFFIVRIEYPWWLRLMPMGMAVILLVITTYNRVNIPKRARAALRRYVRTGVLEEGFIGPHKLIIEDGIIRRSYGAAWSEIPVEGVGGYQQLTNSLLLIAAGVIFEVIPMSILETDNNQDKLIKAIQCGRSEDSQSQQIQAPENTKMTLQWQVEKDTYIRGMVKGHRFYYSTRQAWKGSRMVRMIIFLYGIVVLCMRMNIFIGGAFVLIGLLLNRQLLVTFSPFGYVVVRNQLNKITVNGIELGYEKLYITDSELMAVFMNQVQTTKKKDIICSRHNKEFAFVYTSLGQMFVIPHSIFQSDGEKDRFYNDMGE